MAPGCHQQDPAQRIYELPGVSLIGLEDIQCCGLGNTVSGILAQPTPRTPRCPDLGLALNLLGVSRRKACSATPKRRAFLNDQSIYPDAARQSVTIGHPASLPTFCLHFYPTPSPVPFSERVSQASCFLV